MALISREQASQRENSTALKPFAADALARGFFVFALQPRSKQPRFGSHGFEDAGTTDAALKVWDEIPDANIGIAVGKSDLTVLDFDQGDQFIPEWVNATRTLKVRTGKGLHVYFRGSRSTTKMFVDGKNIGDIKSNGGYVLGHGSIHPDGPVYTIVDDSPVVPLPVDAVNALTKTSQVVDVSPNGERVARGGHDDYLHRVAGKLRYSGLEEEAIYTALVEIVEKRFDDYGTDYLEMCRKHAHNITKKPVGADDRILFSGAEGTTKPAEQVKAETPRQSKPAPDPASLPKFEKLDHPRFPDEIMYGTSVYKNFVKPIAEVNSRVPYFMWYPAMQLMLNYVSTRVRIEGKDFKGNLFSVLVGRKGMIKSSSVEDAVRYMNAAGLVSFASAETKNAEGKSLIWTAGSPEGFGIDMYKTNCKNGVLFYDELATLVKKAGIESSNMVGALLALYESGNFANSIKGKKDSYGMAPGTYAASLIACTTDEAFEGLWAGLSGATTGLNDRFVFVYQPEVIPEPTPQVVVNTDMNAPNTRILIDKAVNQKVYSIFDQTLLRRLYKIDNRFGLRAEKYALYFAIDLGRDEIDEDCIERACMLVDYEIAVKEYIKPFEAVTREGNYQQQVISIIKKNSNPMPLRKLEKLIHVGRLGTSVWSGIYNGLEKAGILRTTETDTTQPNVWMLRDPDAE